MEKQQFEFIGKRFDIKNIGKVTGREIYSCDVNIPGQLHVVVLRSPYAHAEIKGYEILKGARGEASKDIEAIKILLMKVSKLTMENPKIKEIDLNPVFVFEKGLQVIDARMIL